MIRSMVTDLISWRGVGRSLIALIQSAPTLGLWKLNTGDDWILNTGDNWEYNG
jgi:hypothetical protein